MKNKTKIQVIAREEEKHLSKILKGYQQEECFEYKKGYLTSD